MGLAPHLQPLQPQLEEALLEHNIPTALTILGNLASLDAIALLLFTTHRFDSVVGPEELEEVAEGLGVYTEDDDGDTGTQQVPETLPGTEATGSS